jgi:hypothetical protein
MKVLANPFDRRPLLISVSEWEFVQSLAFSSQTPQDASFVQLIYTARLRKYKHAAEHALTRQRLVEEFGLGDNPDVLFSFADALYAGFRWADCFAITTRYGVPAYLSPLLIRAESWDWCPFTTPQCLCTLPACTIYLICTRNYLSWRTKWWTGSQKTRSVGTPSAFGISAMASGQRLDSTLGAFSVATTVCGPNSVQQNVFDGPEVRPSLGCIRTYLCTGRRA